MNGEYGTYLVTQEDLSKGRSTVEIVEASIAGGVDAVQLREKHATARRRTAAAGVDLIVNDRVDIAAAVDADGVHLGDDDLPVSVAREILGDAVVGRSVSTVEAARRAESDGADYLGVGAVFATSSKDVSEEESGIGTGTVSAIADAVSVPVIGIGGITADTAANVVAAGATGVAVISAITAADDPERATRTLADAVASGRDRR